MNEQKTHELIIYLASLGFSGQQLEQVIINNVQSGAPQFNVSHEIPWGEELMRFDLQFQLDHQFKGHRLEWYKATYIASDGTTKNTNYRPSAYGTCHANLAFHSLSGRLNDLSDKLSYLELGEFPGVDIRADVEKMLSRDLNKFTLSCSRNEPEGYIDYVIPVSKTDGWYTLDTYTATLTPYPNIEHGEFYGVNTKELEDQMRKVNWREDQELFILHEDSEPELLPPTIDIQQKILKLSEAPKGALIADILKLKYWSEASFFDAFIEQRAWDYSGNLPKREHQFPADIEAKAAFNLLCGRAILHQPVEEKVSQNGNWIKLNLEERLPNGNYPIIHISGFSIYDLETTLDILPMTAEFNYSLQVELMRGDLAPIQLKNGNNILLQANPERQKIDFFTEDLRPTPVNLNFDPEWNPVQILEINPKEQRRKHRQNTIQTDHPPDKNNPLRKRK